MAAFALRPQRRFSTFNIFYIFIVSTLEINYTVPLQKKWHIPSQQVYEENSQRAHDRSETNLDALISATLLASTVVYR